jgi:hypothetical protein
VKNSWAFSCGENNLGNAYKGRIRGESADNLERAIATYEAALTVRTREAFPQDWASTQNNLGNAYSDRIQGERADMTMASLLAYWMRALAKPIRAGAARLPPLP